MSGSYIPRPDAKFTSWFDNLARNVELHTTGTPPDWSHIPAEATTAFMEAYGRWKNAAQAAKNDPTPSKKKEKTRVREAEETNAIRPYVKQYLHFPPVTNEQRDAAGIPNHKKSGRGGAVADPTDHVEYEFIIDPVGRRIIVKFRILGSSHWGKGRYHSVEIRYWILPLDAPAPVDASAPGWQSDTDTASPWEITGGGEDSGKRIWIAMRWKNRSTGGKTQKNGRGPWSEIRGVVVP